MSVEGPSDLTSDISASGRVTRVTAKCGFLKSARHGGVFVPPSAVLPRGCPDPDLRNYLQEGQLVHFSASPQKSGAPKNGCFYVASRVVLSKANPGQATAATDAQGGSQTTGPAVSTERLQGGGSEGPQDCQLGMEAPPGLPAPPGLMDVSAEFQPPPLMEGEPAFVSRMDVTFGELWSEVFQASIFFPGGAYVPGPDEPNRLNAVFSLGDAVLVWARPQLHHAGCTWIAERVEKLPTDVPLALYSAAFKPPTHNTHSSTASSVQGEVGGDAATGGIVGGTWVPDASAAPWSPAEALGGAVGPAGDGATASDATLFDWAEGRVVSVGTLFGYLHSASHGSVYFPVSAWRGGDGVSEADALTSVVGVGDAVEFCAVPQPLRQSCAWRAVRVRPSSRLQAEQGAETREASAQTTAPHHQPLIRPKPIATAEAAAQTGLTPSELLARAILHNEAASRLCHDLFPHIMAYVHHTQS